MLGAVGGRDLRADRLRGLAGTEPQIDNLAPTMVYVLFWVGVPFVSLFLGDVWRLLSPVAGDRPRGGLR